MTIYRIYHYEYNYINHTDLTDDDSYDDWTEEIVTEVTDKYVNYLSKYEHFCETKREEDDWTDYFYEEIEVK